MSDVNKHWIVRYIGMGWDESYNCFDHFCQVQKEKFERRISDGLTLVPDFDERSEAINYIKTEPSIRRNWLEIKYPQIPPREGDAVLFGVEGFTFHIGTFIYSAGIKGVLHCDKKQGVCLTPLYTIDNLRNSPVFMRYINA